MIRRSLRIGIRWGLLTGLAFVLFKIVQSRRAPRVFGEAEGDGWGPGDGPSSSSSSPGPVLVRPTMPERSVADRDRARPEEPPAEASSVAPGPAEPFAMVGPDPAVTDGSTPVEDTPLDAVAGPVVDVDDPVARARQTEPVPSPAGAPAATKRAAPTKAAEKAAKATTKAAKKAAKVAKKAAKATKRAKKAKKAKKATKRAAKATKRAAPAKAAQAPKKAAAGKATAVKARAGKAAAAKAAAAKAAAGKAAPAKATAGQGGAGWVEPTDGTCPSTHPVKAKMASRIFHLPGMAAYNRTSADRCYSDAAAAESDGLRPAKR